MLAVVSESEKNLLSILLLFGGTTFVRFFFVKKLISQAGPAKMIDFHSRLHAGGATVRL